MVHRCSWPDGGGTHLDTGSQEVPARHLASRPKVRDALASFRDSDKVRSPNGIHLGTLSDSAPHSVHTLNCAAHFHGPNAPELLTVRSSRETSGQDLPCAGLTPLFWEFCPDVAQLDVTVSAVGALEPRHRDTHFSVWTECRAQALRIPRSMFDSRSYAAPNS